MTTPNNQAFHDEVDNLLSDAPMSPVLIERDGKEPAVLMSIDLFNAMKERAEAYDAFGQAGKAS